MLKIDFKTDRKYHNIYRTRRYIVTQVLVLQQNNVVNNTISSHDIFYKRTDKRDKYYELLMDKKQQLNGRRISTAMYTRKYVD